MLVDHMLLFEPVAEHVLVLLDQYPLPLPFLDHMVVVEFLKTPTLHFPC